MPSQYNSSENAQALGLRLRTARNSASMTLEDLAEKLKISHTQISRIERGQFKRTSKNVQILCTFLEIDATLPLQPARNLEARIARIASFSPRWERAVFALVEALEAAQEERLG